MEEHRKTKNLSEAAASNDEQAKSKRKYSREKQNARSLQKENVDNADESYSSILHKLIHSKRLSLQASNRFPQVKPNSFLCKDCSKNMLSYVAVLQDILSVVVGDITEKVSGQSEVVSRVQECPHCGEIPSRYIDKQLKLNQQNVPIVHPGPEPYPDDSRPISKEEITYKNSVDSQPSNSSASRNENPCQSTVGFNAIKSNASYHVSVSESIAAPISKENFVGDSRPGEKNETLDFQIKRHAPVPDNLNVKDYRKEQTSTGQTVVEVQELLAKLQPFGQKPSTAESWKMPQEIPTTENQFLLENSSSAASMTLQHNDEKSEFVGLGNRSFSQSTSPVFDSQSAVESYSQGEACPDSDEAYVTLATNNQSAILCLVLGYSLLATKTSRTRVVLVTEGVCRELWHDLLSVYNVVQSVDSLGTKEITKLSLLEDPELGISFVKLHVWQLTAFKKCVFLDPSTLVVKNCDELFKREELSAVPDIGWPDCFNSGVFVYVPSLETFWNLTDFLESQESYDGGDQGLLNMYFKNWASDISRKLPFIYNMMANVSYTYKPALNQFGNDVKIVHFFGSYKPWNVPFHSATGDLIPTADVHPTFVQFVKYWLDIFVECVLLGFDDEVLMYGHKQKYITVQELLQFFPSTPMPETLPIQPSFRLYPDFIPIREDPNESTVLNLPEVEETASGEPDDKSDDAELTLPGSEVGDYRGMEAWEQGKADYLGLDKSDRIMARLDFLMQDSSKSST